jgi:hypothetical protein
MLDRDLLTEIFENCLFKNIEEDPDVISPIDRQMSNPARIKVNLFEKCN